MLLSMVSFVVSARVMLGAMLMFMMMVLVVMFVLLLS